MSSSVLTPINPTPTPTGATNPQITVTGAPPAAPVQHPDQLVKMWAPGAQPGDEPGDVYAEKVHDAVLAGGTLAVPFTDPNGQKGYVALHKLQDAIKAGGHIDDPVINALSDTAGVKGVGTGFAKGAIDTMRGAADLMGGPGMAEKVGVPNVDTTPTGIGEKIGKGGEAVLGFLLGDETLKGLSLGEKLGKIAPIVKAVESYPSLAKLIGGALRGSTVGGAQGAVKGEAQGNALGGAITGAELGAAGGAVAEVPGAIRAAGAAGAGAESAAAPNLISKVVKGEGVAQPALRQSLKTASESAVESAGVEDSSLPTPHTSSVRNFLNSPIEALATKERATYDSLNEAAGTDLKSLHDYAEDLRNELDEPSSLANRPALQKELARVQDSVEQAEQQAIKNGISPDTLNLAKGMTQQRYAMEDVAKKLFGNESVVNGNIQFGSPETINVNAAIKNAENLNKISKFAPRGTPSRLEQALGEDGANRLLSELYKAQKVGKQAVKAQQIAKWAAMGLGVGGAGALLHGVGQIVP